jgi:P4 family phage/plasmid primase-like protien
MIEVDRDTIEAFAALFQGRSDAHGYVNECIYEPVTITHYEKHLKGEINLGVYFVLDDSTCSFATIDLDEKDFNKAKAIRDDLVKCFIPAYIAESKSRGFHIYCFAFERFKAVEIRQVLHHILKKLNIKAEIFPKQDYHQPDDPDGTRHPGSYINLPCFGHTRPFLSGDRKEVLLKVVLERIKFVPQESIDRLLRALPKEKATLPPQAVESPDDELAVKKLLEHCAFIQHCRDNAVTLPEPFWWSMVHCLSVFGEQGRKKIHELSKTYPGYSNEETNKKIKEAEKVANKDVGPHTCLFIEQGGFVCPKDCLAKKLKVKAPAGLASILATQEIRGPYLYRDKQGWHSDIPKLVDDLLTEYSFKTMRDNEECLIYEGIYTPLGEVRIREECESRVPKRFMTTHNVNEVIGHIKRSTYIDRKKFNLEKWVLNLENGLYDIQTGELSSHTREFLSTIRIPVSYEPKADCPRVRLFLSEILREKDIPVIEEIFGYCLIPDYTIQRAFLLMGDGANGKSTLLELLKHFLGADNCSSISLQSIESQRFAVADLFGKLANIYADIPSTKIPHVGLFKMLTGGDTIGAEKKFRDRFSFNNCARLIFSTNIPPKVDEDTLAFWRRWIFINLPNKFQGGKADKQLLRKLTPKSELSGLLNIALRGLKRLLSQSEFSYELTPDEIAEWHQKASDSIYAFVEDICEANSAAWISKDALYEAFLKYCDKQNIPRIGKESFGRALKNAKNVHVMSQRSGPRGVQVHGWGGIKLKGIDMEV